LSLGLQPKRSQFGLKKASLSNGLSKISNSYSMKYMIEFDNEEGNGAGEESLRIPGCDSARADHLSLSVNSPQSAT
jgi:hypothetical protein